jgi:hypothetical protein
MVAGDLFDQVLFRRIRFSEREQTAADAGRRTGVPPHISLKRGIKGTYVSVEPFHLFRYLDEQTFRFNNRKIADGERFGMAVDGIISRRLTFDQLIGKANIEQMEAV